MVLVRDEDFHHVEAQFKEAVFTHASTSPNLQIIASSTWRAGRWSSKATSW